MNESPRVNSSPRPTLDAYVSFANISDHADKAVTEIEGNRVKSTLFGRLMHSWFGSSRELIVENFKEALKAKYPSFALTEVPKGPLTGAVIKQVVSKAEAERKSTDNLEAMVLLSKIKADIAQKAAEKTPANPDAQRAAKEAKAAAYKVDAIVTEINENQFDSSKLNDLIQEAEDWTTVASSKAEAFGRAIDIHGGNEQSHSSKDIEDVYSSLRDVNSIITDINSRAEKTEAKELKQQARYEALTKLAQVELEHPPITTLKQEELQIIQDISDAIISAERDLAEVSRNSDEQLINEKETALLISLSTTKGKIPSNGELIDQLARIKRYIGSDLEKIKLLKEERSLSIIAKQEQLAALSLSIQKKFEEFQKAIKSPVPQTGDDDGIVIERDSTSEAERVREAQKKEIRETCSACSSLLDQLYVRYQETVKLQQYAENNALLAARVATLAPFSSSQKVVVIPEKKDETDKTKTELVFGQEVTPRIIPEPSLTAAEMSQGFNNHLHHATRLVEREKKAIRAFRNLIASAQNLEQLKKAVARGNRFLEKMEKDTLSQLTYNSIDTMREWLKPLHKAAKKRERELDAIKFR